MAQYGDGCIIRKGDRTFEIQLNYGRDPITGKRIRKTRTIHGTKTQARQALRDMQNEKDGGLSARGGGVQFCDLASRYLQSREISGKIGATRLRRETYAVRLFNRYLSTQAIGAITPESIEGLVFRVRADKLKERGTYSNTTLRDNFFILRRVFKYAKTKRLITFNPVLKELIPSNDPPKRQSLENSDINALYDLLKRSYLRFKGDYRLFRGSCPIISLISLLTGARRGEVLALQWSSVDFEAECISITQSIDALGNIKAPKTKAGVRTVAIPHNLACMLLEWREQVKRHLFEHSVKFGDSMPVGMSGVYTYINPRNFERWWLKWRAENGFDGLKFHELRHSYSTALIAGGVDVKSVQTALGHARANTTLDIYTHSQKSIDRKGAKIMSEITKNETEGRETAGKTDEEIVAEELKTMEELGL
ncbi:MAG: site-specific integrase [Synergistes sp.]|nr:site-specific integrase [Synergistes sp.]